MADFSHLGNLYIKAIERLDVKFFMAVTGCQREESALISLHKLRWNCDQISDLKRLRSKRWLLKRGYQLELPALRKDVQEALDGKDVN